MATSTPVSQSSERPACPFEGRWKERAAAGKLLAAMGDWMAEHRDYDEVKAESRVFHYIRSMPKRKK